MPRGGRKTSPSSLHCSSTMRAALPSLGVIGILHLTSLFSVAAETSEDGKRISGWFMGNNTDSSNCPELIWMRKLAAASTTDKSLVFINVGFNKGYNFAEFLNHFATWTLVTPAKWRQCLETSNPHVHIDSPMGACNDGSFQTPQDSPSYTSPTPSTSTAIKLIGVDIFEGNKKMVMNTYRCAKRAYSRDRNHKNINLHLYIGAGNVLT